MSTVTHDGSATDWCSRRYVQGGRPVILDPALVAAQGDDQIRRSRARRAGCRLLDCDRYVSRQYGIWLQRCAVLTKCAESVPDALVNLLRNSSMLFRPNALYELASKGIPNFAETMTDAKTVSHQSVGEILGQMKETICSRPAFVGSRRVTQARLRGFHSRFVFIYRQSYSRFPGQMHGVPLVT